MAHQYEEDQYAEELEPTQEELEAIEAEIEADRDYLLEQQELEDYENFYGPCDYDEPW